MNISIQPSVTLICWHGYLGHWREFDPLIQVLTQHGYQVCTPSLPGHGDWTGRLASINSLVLQDVIWQTVLDISRQSDYVVLTGHSLGGVCALLAAAMWAQNADNAIRQKLLGVVTLSSPHSTVYTVNRPLGLLNHPGWLEGLRHIGDSWTGLPKPRLPFWRLPRLIKEADRLLAHLQDQLPAITVPVCLMHGRHDLVVPVREVYRLHHGLIHAKRRELHILEHCGHQIFPRSPEAPHVTESLLCFIDSLKTSAEAVSSVGSVDI